MAINNTADRRAFERRFFLVTAILFAIVIVIGFGPTYYLKGFFNSPPVARTVIHVHALLMAAWVALFAIQVYFIRSTKIKTHQQLGLASIVLAIGIVITGLYTAIAATKYGSISMPAGVKPLEFFVVPFFDVLVFAVLFAAAVYYRRNAPNHKRLMLLTVLNFVPPAIARFPGGLTDSLGPIWFFGVPDAIAILCVVVDTWRNRKLNPVFLGGAVFMIVSHWARLPFSTTETWLSFAMWLTGAN